MKKLWLLIFFVLFFATSASARDLKLGSSGEDVKKWQIFLIARNFDLPVDGKYGSVTKRATTIFQKKWKLYVDGVVGKQTMRKARQLNYDRIVSAYYRSGSSSQNNTPRLSTSQIKYQVMQYLNENLHDPASAQILRWGNVTTSNDQTWTYAIGLKYRAKNMLGAYVLSYKIFFLSSQGDVIASENIE